MLASPIPNSEQNQRKEETATPCTSTSSSTSTSQAKLISAAASSPFRKRDFFRLGFHPADQERTQQYQLCKLCNNPFTYSYSTSQSVLKKHLINAHSTNESVMKFVRREKNRPLQTPISLSASMKAPEFLDALISLIQRIPQQPLPRDQILRAYQKWKHQATTIQTTAAPMADPVSTSSASRDIGSQSTPQSSLANHKRRRLSQCSTASSPSTSSSSSSLPSSSNESGSKIEETPAASRLKRRKHKTSGSTQASDDLQQTRASSAPSTLVASAESTAGASVYAIAQQQSLTNFQTINQRVIWTSPTIQAATLIPNTPPCFPPSPSPSSQPEVITSMLNHNSTVGNVCSSFLVPPNPNVRYTSPQLLLSQPAPVSPSYVTVPSSLTSTPVTSQSPNSFRPFKIDSLPIRPVIRADVIGGASRASETLLDPTRLSSSVPSHCFNFAIKQPDSFQFNRSMDQSITPTSQSGFQPQATFPPRYGTIEASTYPWPAILTS